MQTTPTNPAVIANPIMAANKRFENARTFNIKKINFKNIGHNNAGIKRALQAVGTPEDEIVFITEDGQIFAGNIEGAWRYRDNDGMHFCFIGRVIDPKRKFPKSYRPIDGINIGDAYVSDCHIPPVRLKS